jgi:exodeoxyribonuclease VII small subunit
MNPPSDDMSYEDALVELDRIVRVLEDGQTTLEEAISNYEKGVGLIKRCYQGLSQAEQRIRMLCGQDEQGQPILQQFAHASAMEAEQNEAARRRNRTAGAG